MKVGVTRRTIAAGAAAVLVAAGGGAAIAATTTLDRAEESRAVIDAAAEQLGVESSELSDALRGALAARIDAGVEAGRLTEEQAAELKERIAEENFPLLGFGAPGHGHGPGHGFGGRGAFLDFGAAAEYLGVPTAELRDSLHDEGATLAERAQEAEGKSVDGLVDALVAAAEERLAAGVEAGRITEERRDELAAGLRERLTEAVNREHRGHGFGRERPTA